MFSVKGPPNGSSTSKLFSARLLLEFSWSCLVRFFSVYLQATFDSSVHGAAATHYSYQGKALHLLVMRMIGKRGSSNERSGSASGVDAATQA